MTRYIFVTGGVVSSLGKGIASASIAAILEARGLKVGMTKLDPYLNVDPGTMSPYQHGEVFVTADGAETDLDLGHYERFTNFIANRNNNFTAGQIYESILRRERNGDYLGATVQVIPHVIDEIKSAIKKGADENDILITEIGGTAGDIESLPFLEAIRQIGIERDRGQVLYIHLTLVPYIRATGEFKTKPTQHSVKELRSIGIQPDILLCRSEATLSDEHRKKIALFCNVRESEVISERDVDDIYEIPVDLHKQGVDQLVVDKLDLLSVGDINLDSWHGLIERRRSLKMRVTIGIVGKYIQLIDSYISINEALKHAGMQCGVKVDIRYIYSHDISVDQYGQLEELDGILVPGGFGERGIEGKIATATFARMNKVPYFGICLGMQAAVIETARNLAGMTDANSTEFDPETEHPVIALLSEWSDEDGNLEQRDENTDKGGSMRLGEQLCHFRENGRLVGIYGSDAVKERHRHRYEVNATYWSGIEKAGLVAEGVSHDEKLVEVINLPDHPWFIGCQYHPEFKSRPASGHPLFISFVQAVITHKNQTNE